MTAISKAAKSSLNEVVAQRLALMCGRMSVAIHLTKGGEISKK
jgi:hypothetical protein